MFGVIKVDSIYLPSSRKFQFVTSCRAEGPEAANLQQLLKDSGSTVTLAKCDTSFLEDSAACLDAAAVRRVGGSGIAGLLMAGGVLSDAVLPSQTAGRLKVLSL